MDVETRLTRLEDRVQIQALRARYCYSADDRDWDAFVDLFSPTATLDFGPIGEFDGPDGVRELTKRVDAEHPFLAHMVHNPLIEFQTDDRAFGRWYFEVPCTYKDGSAGWIQGTYWDEYKRVDDRWLFDAIEADFNYFAEYDEGWASIVDDSH